MDEKNLIPLADTQEGQETDIENLMVLRQIPVIEEHLMDRAAAVKARIELACSMACTPETVKEVKKMRAELNKEFARFEEARKTLKAAVMAPYEAFQRTYDESIGDAYKQADIKLRQMIQNTEYHLRDQREKLIRSYFNEQAQSCGLDQRWTFEKTGITVLLSGSMTAYKKQVKDWIDQRVKDIACISDMPQADQVMAEYNNSLNLADAVKAVKERQTAQEAARRELEEAAAQREAREEKTAELVRAVAEEAPAPTPVEEPAMPREETTVYTLRFTVRGTKEKLKLLKTFLDNGGYDYGNI